MRNLFRAMLVQLPLPVELNLPERLRSPTAHGRQSSLSSFQPVCSQALEEEEEEPSFLLFLLGLINGV